MSAELAVVTNPDEIAINYPPDKREPRGPMSVYVIYGQPGQILYVGQTLNVRRRVLQHRRLAWWWSQTTSVSVMAGNTRDEAAAIERACIESASPIGNTHYIRRPR